MPSAGSASILAVVGFAAVTLAAAHGNVYVLLTIILSC